MRQDFFNLRDYNILLDKLKKEYKFALFSDKTKKKKIFLRHDIDFHPIFLEPLLKIYKKKKIKTNLFFLINSPNYNFLNEDILKIILSSEKDGHLIGLHIDNYYNKNMEQYIKNTFNYFSNFVKLSKYITFHKPSKKILKFKMNGFINCYNENFFSDKIYVSDSARKLSFLSKVNKLVSSKSNKFQMLVHPVWWTTKKSNIEKKIINNYELSYKKFFRSVKPK